MTTSFDAPTTAIDDISGDYTLDVSHSRLGFVARHAMVTKVRGQFDEFEGSAVIDGADIAKSTATVTIQAASIDTRNSDRDAHLRSNDFLDMDKSLNEGALDVPILVSWELASYTSYGFFDNDKKLRDYTPEELDLLLYGKDRKYKLNVGNSEMNASYEGLVVRLEKKYVKRDIKTIPERTLKKIAPYLSLQPCSSCKGARLNQAALASRAASTFIS